ncbi:MAG TPA: phosphohistidine phosphatase [Cytophagales bacterium]|nr:phosphohistidine phosphatase [Cytophagales bacterium]HAA21328.1 phosphohistidine phosphatase [Cytophagales bacterium]HAP58372.1 phosphohistidine phosphatase [Cytophagales bacterium]
MTKQLWLIRHAEAEESGFQTRDFDRKLTQRGIQAATRLGGHLHGIFPECQRIISSPAHRCQATAVILAGQYNYDLSGVVLEKEIYEASLRTFLSLINQIPDTINKVMMVGHNPTVTYLTEYLTQDYAGGFSPATAALLTQETDTWQTWSQGTATLQAMVRPETLSGH